MTYTNKCQDSIANVEGNFIIITVDNNQCGQRQKQQCGGISNNYSAVTQSIALRPTTFNNKNLIPTRLQSDVCNISYVNQSVISHLGMGKYKTVVNLDVMESTIMGNIDIKEATLSIDYSSSTVQSYHELVTLSYYLT